MNPISARKNLHEFLKKYEVITSEYNVGDLSRRLIAQGSMVKLLGKELPGVYTCEIVEKLIIEMKISLSLWDKFIEDNLPDKQRK